jgi:putative FmdB family regulatory protein
MPTYQYECEGCGHSFEILQSIRDKKLRKCPQCHALKLQRLIGTGGGIIFKGSGFYETDYKKKSSAPDTCPIKDSPGKKCPASCSAASHGH